MAKLSRRQFGLGAGATLLAAPFLGLTERTVRADDTKSAKRLIVFFTPNGTVHEHWRPTGSGSPRSSTAAGKCWPSRSRR